MRNPELYSYRLTQIFSFFRASQDKMSAAEDIIHIYPQRVFLYLFQNIFCPFSLAFDYYNSFLELYITVTVISLYTPFCAYTHIVQLPFPTALITPFDVTVTTFVLLLL